VLAMTWSRVLRLLVGGLGTAALIRCGAPSAAADSTNGGTECHSSVESGVEVDTCTGNPDASDDGGPQGDRVRVIPKLCIGLGFGACDD
jgi:hypothetical protein